MAAIAPSPDPQDYTNIPRSWLRDDALHDIWTNAVLVAPATNCNNVGGQIVCSLL
jgi:hypothetical protein